MIDNEFYVSATGEKYVDDVTTPVTSYQTPEQFQIYRDCGISKQEQPVTFLENKTIAKRGGKIAKNARVDVGELERFAFYERAKQAYALIATGEGAVYANIILKKGVIN